MRSDLAGDRVIASDTDKQAIRRAKLTDFIRKEAASLGFDLCRITNPDNVPDTAIRLKEFVDAGYHGTMSWMEETLERRSSPKGLWGDVRSIVMFGLNYGPDEDPRPLLLEKDKANISVYARNRDYHDIIKGRLKELATRFAARSGEDVKVFVDTAPVMEKPLAAAAGFGWQGKHTNLVSKTHGSWLFLGSMFTTADLDIDEPVSDHCGSCKACLTACPTDAFPAPYKLDARRCISYLTIEHRGPIPHEFREKIGNRIYGCDDCLSACPWNKFAKQSSELKLQAREDLKAPEIAFFLTLDDPTFRTFFSGSPIKRIGRNRFVRNVLMAAGNSGNTLYIERCLELLSDPSPDVRGMAIWTLKRLMPAVDFQRLAESRSMDEDSDVENEWAFAAGA
jgi:epoxyqueuosine reductase